MSSPASLAGLIGEWTGTNRLWLSPQEPVQGSETTASVALAAQGRFATIKYTWADGGRPQDGLLILGMATPQNPVDAVWIDSWHTGDKFMLCQREARSDAIISAKGAYAAPPGPDWGWRIVIQCGGADAFQMAMYNISPDGQEALAVEARYSRQL